MKTQVYLGIAIRLIVLFGVGMLLSFIPEQLRGFFGDETCIGKTYKMYGETRKGCPYEGFGIDQDWKWGVRHYWYYWMMFLLFLLSLVNIILSIIGLVTKHYPELK
jgi:hypothetical protein